MYRFPEGSWGCGKIQRPVLQPLLPMDGLSDQFLRYFFLMGYSKFLGPFPSLFVFPLFFPKCQQHLVGIFVFLFICVWCVFWSFLLIPFDSFLRASCKKHFVFISRQHLTISSVLPACHHSPCRGPHSKTGVNKCLATLSAVQTARVDSYSNYSHRQP